VDTILERLSRLDAVTDSAGPHAAGVDRRVFQAALEAEMADGLTTIGRLGEGLFIGPVSLAVGIDADLVIVLGMVEGCLPGGLGDDPLLSDASRRVLGGALPTATERRQRLHHQLLAVAGAARTVVVASRPRADLRSGRARYASRWLAGLDALGAPGPTRTHGSFPAGLHDGLPPASEQEAILGDLHDLAVAHRPPGLHPAASADDPLRRGLALVAARTSEQFTVFDGNLAPLAAEGVDLGPRQPTSASALEAWAACPFAYFVRYLLGVREIDAPDEELSLRPTERGKLVHAVLDAVIAERINRQDVPSPNEPWSVPAREDLAAALGSWCAGAEARGIVGHPLLWRLEQRRLRRRVDAFLALDRQARAELGITPDATEMEFGYDAPFTIGLPDGRELTLVGTVDRVDTGAGPAGSVAVIDYKTGRAPSPWEPDPFAGGVRLQLPIYGVAARERLGRPHAPLAAEYWYLHDQRKEGGRRRLDVGPGTLDRLPAVLAEIVDAMAAGLFTPHPDEPNPWRRSRCPCCDPDGADTATLWSQWQSKGADPALMPYIGLIDGATADSGGPS
jgi:RecB family exonuclease